MIQKNLDNVYYVSLTYHFRKNVASYCCGF